MASTSQPDDGFREIQLNGKQLVFVFMAATVVSVVIFLCGVLVGRGVRGGEREASTSAAAPAVDVKPDLSQSSRPPTTEPPQGGDPTKAEPPAPPAGDAERGEELVKPKTSAANATTTPAPAASAPAAKADLPPPAKAEASKSAPPPAAKSAPAVAKSEAPVKAEPTKAADAKREPAKPDTKSARADVPTGTSGIPAVDDPKRGWVIQVAAVKTRGEAEGLAKDLGAKGYSAFILSGNANVFRVRVGGYKSKRDAENVAAKLRREERINPWVTR